MDVFIQTPELVRLVAHELGDAKRSVLSLALTSRSFLEPSLDSLWCNIRGLQPILSPLPSDLWVAADDEDSDDEGRKVCTFYHCEWHDVPWADRVLTRPWCSAWRGHWNQKT